MSQTIVSDEFLAAVQEARAYLETQATHCRVVAETSFDPFAEWLARNNEQKLRDLAARLDPNKRNPT